MRLSSPGLGLGSGLAQGEGWVDSSPGSRSDQPGEPTLDRERRGRRDSPSAVVRFAAVVPGILEPAVLDDQRVPPSVCIQLQAPGSLKPLPVLGPVHRGLRHAHYPACQSRRAALHHRPVA